MSDLKLKILREFYDNAVNCEALERNPYFWICRKTSKACSPKSCPHFSSKSLCFPEEKVQELSKLIVTAKSTKEGRLVYSRKEISNKPQAKRSKPCPLVQVQRSRPGRLVNGKFRVSVLFHHRKHQKLERWSFSVAVNKRLKKPKILRYRVNKKGLTETVTFCVPPGHSVESLKVLVGSYFEGLHMIDESSPLNRTGSPEYYQVDLVEV